MAEVIIMPKLGFNMDNGQLVAWHKKVGEAVKKGEPLFDINTDKTTMPVEATSDGVLLKTMLNEGEFADVFTPIAVVGAKGEDADAALAAHGGGEAPSGAAAPAAAADASAPAAASTQVPASASTGDLKLTPKARKLIADEGIDPASLAGVAGTGFRGGITARDIKASPLAKKIAARDGVALASVQGSGHGGKVMAADVRAASGAAGAAAPASGGANALGKTVSKTVPYSGVRKIIGDRLAQSKFTAPHLYFTDSVDMSAFTAFRKELIEKTGQKIAVSDFFTLAAAKALRKYPDMNVSLEGDQIVFWESVNIG
ncbi:MAG: 2-oxo acid dehydrogenase subunit E2, partial [Planctomycetota bacterium]|nr:2-oxo acid dehydrogenase subunit E2 [Planctomycetota bacterium]